MSPQSLFRTSKAVCAAAVFSAALPSAALADSQHATVTSLHSKTFTVANNTVEYTQMSPQANLVADVRVEADAGYSGLVKSWSVFLILLSENGHELHFSDHAFSKTYPWDERPNSVDRTKTLSVPASRFEDFLVARCNQLADEMRDGGMKNGEIFHEDHSFELAVRPELSVDFSGPGSVFGLLEQAEGWQFWEKVEVVCKKWTGSAGPQVAGNLTFEPAQVVNHGLSLIEVSTINGACKIRLDGWITTDHKGAEVSFRYKDQDGKISQLHSVNTGDSKTATFSHWYDVPNNPDGAENGHVWMEGASHDFQSEIVAYGLNCVEGGPNTIVSNDPPKLSMAVVPHGKVMVHGRICPEVVKLVGVLTGQGNFSGQALFFGPGYLSPLRDYSITHGQKVIVGAEAELDWDDVPAPPVANAPIVQMREFGLNVTNDNNVVIAALPKKTVFLECHRPMVNPGLQLKGDLTLEPSQPAAGVKGTARFKAPPQTAPAQLMKARPAPSSQPNQSPRRWLLQQRRIKQSGN